MTDEVVNQFDDNPYDEVDSRHDSWSLRHTEFRETTISILKNNFVKHDTMVAYEVLANDLMSSNAFMSNQTPPKRGLKSMFSGESQFNQLEYTKLSIDECIAMFYASVDPLDRNKNVVYQMVNELLNHTINFTLTRTIGDRREGLENRLVQTKHTQENRETALIEQEHKKIKTKGPF